MLARAGRGRLRLRVLPRRRLRRWRFGRGRVDRRALGRRLRRGHLRRQLAAPRLTGGTGSRVRGLTLRRARGGSTDRTWCSSRSCSGHRGRWSAAVSHSGRPMFRVRGGDGRRKRRPGAGLSRHWTPPQQPLRQFGAQDGGKAVRHRPLKPARGLQPRAAWFQVQHAVVIQRRGGKLGGLVSALLLRFGTTVRGAAMSRLTALASGAGREAAVT